VRRISDHVYLIEGERGGRYPWCNCLFIEDSRTCLIDSGAGSKLESLAPDIVINTHWHEDHIALNYKFDSKIHAHRLDAEAIESFDEFKRRYALTEELIKIFVNFEFCKVHRKLEDGEKLRFGDAQLEVIHTPGHSAGHCCLLIDDDKKILYLGDIDLTSFGPWYGCVDCDVSDFIASIEKIEEVVRRYNIRIAVPSHGEIASGKGEILKKLKLYKEKIFEREMRIKKLLPATPDELVGRGIIYRKLPQPLEAFSHFEKIMIEKHLERIYRSLE
jgi:glyoxylase-like metal-dependent hydrolase (beta-lactamase superfamily II)